MEIFRSLAKYLAYFVFIINQIRQKGSPDAVDEKQQLPGITVFFFIRKYFYKPQDSQNLPPAEYFPPLSLHNVFTVNLYPISNLMQTVLFSQKFFHFQNLSITPDSFQVIEETVLLIKYMNDQIAVIL